MPQPDDEPLASGTIEIAASAEAAYALVSDVIAMAEVNAENTGAGWVRGDPGAVGSVFRGRNRNGVRRWSTTCTVEESAAPHRFAFGVTYFGIPVARWAYAVEQTGPATSRVTESMWDRRPGWFKRPGGWATGVTDRTAGNSEHIAATLGAVKAHLER